MSARHWLLLLHRPRVYLRGYCMYAAPERNAWRLQLAPVERSFGLGRDGSSSSSGSSPTRRRSTGRGRDS